MACSEYCTFHNGDKMPLIGYGTWQAAEGELEPALDAALRAGYRHIDTAAFYLNEAVIGKVLEEDWIGAGKVTREELFLVSKLPPCGMRPAGVRFWLERSLKALRTDYLDLFLVHVPFGFADAGDQLLPMNEEGTAVELDRDTDHVAIWRALEEEADAGRVKAIGLSNFTRGQVQRILDSCRIKPANLQVELHVFLQQRELVEFCEENGITVTAYSPLGSPGTGRLYASAGIERSLPDLLNQPAVLAVAALLDRTPAQVLLRHIVQRGIAALPKSVNEERIAFNIQVFDFELSAEDVAQLDELDQGAEGRLIDLTFLLGAENHPEYPF